MSNPVFFCADLTGDVVVLAGAEGRHAATVRRLRVGEAVDLVDGLGLRCAGVIVSAAKDTLTVQVASRVLEAVPSPRITLVQALAKGDRGELAVELATEVGVDVIVPWSASRSISRWEGDRGAKALERWRSTAREAAKQSRRAWFPVVAEPVTTAQIPTLPLDVALPTSPHRDLAGFRGVSGSDTPRNPAKSVDGGGEGVAPAGARSAALLVLHESADTQLSAVDLAGDIVLVVGPEGGVSEEELRVLLQAGGTAVRLGGSVLRTSSAGAVGAAVVMARTGRW